MRKIMITLSFICIFSIGLVYGGEENKNNVDIIVPPGMETIKEGDVNLVVYKGGRMSKQDDVLITETPDEYASRKFSDTDNRFKKIEKELEDLRSVVKKLEEDGRKK